MGAVPDFKRIIEFEVHTNGFEEGKTVQCSAELLALNMREIENDVVGSNVGLNFEE
jgi:hypothetical protein